MWHIWLIIAGVCFIIEIMTVGFLVFWFGIGALLAMVVSLLFPGNWFLQSTVFIISSTLLIFLTKPFVEKFTKKDKSVATNAYSIIGKKGIATQDINPTHDVGQVKIAGEVWSAKTSDGSFIEKGSQIIVTNIEGVKAIVELSTSNSTVVTK
ncbi:MAG: NfeD family protein [Clostridiaceae bacterium]|nr:NfeD family protein [Clostridiaceae bacterium]